MLKENRAGVANTQGRVVQRCDAPRVDLVEWVHNVNLVAIVCAAVDVDVGVEVLVLRVIDDTATRILMVEM